MKIIYCYVRLLALLLVLSACKKGWVDTPPTTGEQDSTCSLLNEYVRVATYNVEYDNRNNTSHLWESRKNLVANLFQIYQFDIVALQEPYVSQLADLKQLLPAYHYTGTTVRGSTTTDKQLSVGILYRPERLELLDSGMFWLSETPDVDSKGWDNSQYRVCNWGRFEQKNNGKQFYYFSVHLGFGTEAREQSIALLQNKIQAIANSMPAMLAGDFNFSQYDDVYFDMFHTGFFYDSYLLAQQQFNPYEGTYLDYGNQLSSTNRIDHIFTANCRSFQILSRKVLNDNFNGLYPSDHAPVMIDLIIPESCNTPSHQTDTIKETFQYATIKGTYPMGNVIAPSGLWIFNGALVYHKEPTDYRPMAPRLIGVNERGTPDLLGPGYIETGFGLDGLKRIAVEFVPMPDVYDVGPDFSLEIQYSTDDGVHWNSLGFTHTTKGIMATAEYEPNIPAGRQVKIRLINTSPQMDTNLLRGNRINILKVTFIKP